MTPAIPHIHDAWGYRSDIPPATTRHLFVGGIPTVDGATVCAHNTPDDKLCPKCGRNEECRWNDDGECRCEGES